MLRRAVEIALVVPEDGQIAQLVAGALLVAEVGLQRQPCFDSGDATLHVAHLCLGQPDVAEGVGQPGLIAGLLQEPMASSPTSRASSKRPMVALTMWSR